MKTTLHVFILIFCLLVSPSGTTAGGHSFAPDTLYAVAIGSTTPPIDPNGDPVTNGDFTITRSGGNDIVGDGVDDRTEWRLSYTSTDYDTTDLVVSALLTVMIEPKDPSANNDNIEIDDCDCTDISVGSHPLHQVYTAEFEMLDYGYESRLFIDSLRLNGGFVMRYQDDGIVSYAEVRLVVVRALTIESPAAGDLWIAGEQSTIRWASTDIDSVEIGFSTDFEDGGGSFETIVESYPGDKGEYVWNVPDSILSRKCAISIGDASNPSVFSFSDVFKIKGYRLTRVDTSGQYEPYYIGEDSWIFANAPEHVWPPSWYQQFDYDNGIDPFTDERYASDFRRLLISAEPEDFPDWPSFVRVFGVENCYYSLGFNIPNPFVVTYWALQNGQWEGSCAGFSASSFLAFDHKSDFRSRFDVPDFNELIELAASDDTRKVINELWTYQCGSTQRANGVLRDFTRPNETLFFAKEMFRSEAADNQEIYMYDDSPAYAHAVNPWKIEEDPSLPGIWDIFVYDNNYPFLTGQKIRVNTDANSWNYGDVGGSGGLILSLRSSSYLQNALLPFSGEGPAVVSGSELVSVFNTPSSSIVFVNQSGDSVVYRNTDSSYTASIEGAVPDIPLTGYPHPPIGYSLPDDEYSISLSNFQDSHSYFSVLDTGLVLQYGRSDATSGQTDLLGFDSGIGVRNPDPASKVCHFAALIVEESAQKLADVTNCTMVQDDSLHIRTVNADDVEFVNEGPEKTYDLSLGFASATGYPRFEHPVISLPGNSTHTIIPEWMDLSLPVTILVDLGNNGTIDDTLTVGNTVSVNDLPDSGIPREFALSQNYPNPFNPVTVISYQLPTASHVALRVYDVLGRHVATPVDEVQGSGYRQVTFDASALASGVYYYQIDIRSVTTNQVFRDVKKMMVVK